MNCEVLNTLDEELWDVAYCHINADKVDIEIKMDTTIGLKKSELQIGEPVMFLDKQNNLLFGTVVKLNQKTVGVNVSGNNWKVSYTLLRKAKDMDAEIIKRNFIEMN